MDTDLESEQQNQAYSWSEALSDMKHLLSTIEGYNQNSLTPVVLRELLNAQVPNYQKLKTFIQDQSCAKNLEPVSMLISDSTNENILNWKFSVSNKNSLSGLTTIIPCPLLLTLLSELQQDLRLGIINLFGIFSIRTSLIYLHSYRCIMRDSVCSIILNSPSDTTKFDIVIPKKTKPIQGAVLTALPRVFPRPGFLLQWKSTSKRAKEFTQIAN